MSTLNMLARQPAHGLGGGRQRKGSAGWLKKKKSQIGGTLSTLVQLALGKKKRIICHIDGYWPLIYYLKEQALYEGGSIFSTQRLCGNIL